MALHEVQLKGYNVRPGNLSLGTFGSYGIEQLHVTLDDTWSGLAVTATFNPPKGEPREIRLPETRMQLARPYKLLTSWQSLCLSLRQAHSRCQRL